MSEKKLELNKEKKLTEDKKKLLFDERGMIRGGIKSMTNYAKILFATDEDDLDRVINEIMEEGNESKSENE